MIIVVVNLDPHGARETTVHLDLPALGLEWLDSFMCAMRSPARNGVAPEQLCAARPRHIEPAHVLTVRSPR